MFIGLLHLLYCSGRKDVDNRTTSIKGPWRPFWSLNENAIIKFKNAIATMEIIETTRALRKPNSDGLFDYLVIRQGLMSDYHNHKENMANAGILVQISLFGAVVTESIWPPNWVAHNFSTPEAWTFLAYFMLWGLVHIHIRWQLKNKESCGKLGKGIG